MGKVTIDLGMKTDGVEIVADTLTVELDEKELERPAATAAASAVRNGIRRIATQSADGTHRLFNKTGHLASGIKADGPDVVAPPGYLQEDELVDRLIAEVPALRDPLSDQAFQLELEHVVAALLKVSR